MELNDKPQTAKFTASRDVRLVSDAGDMCTNFEAGETKVIHRSLFAVAIREGLVPEEPLEAPPPPVVKPPQEKIVSDGLVEACKTLILRGVPGDFTIHGKPRAASVKKLVDFDFTARDVADAFEKAMHEVEQDGNNDEERTEPSSSAAE